VSTSLDAAGEETSSLGLWVGVARPHILAIVFASTLTYGWIFTEQHSLLIPLIAVWDWFIVNFTNKATDLEEDLANGIPGARQIARHQRRVEWINWLMIVGGLAAGLVVLPGLLPWRLLFTFIGLIYNYRWIPWPGGRTRLKETYFFKNFGSSMLFTLSVFIYPLVGLGAEYPVQKLLLAIAFFIPLELTYEIIYDLRDVDGDRQQGVPTYPVVHGVDVAKKIIYGLLAFSAIWPIVGVLAFELRLREWVVVAGVLQQLLLMRWVCGGARLPTTADAIRVTWIGAAQLASYNVWILIGLPLGA
jgi:4-hydroxybenzoate polyprenyltransferase